MRFRRWLPIACIIFDEFRAPAEEELARRRRAKLNSRQLEYLNQWGYPYVLDEWRFRATLTGSLEPELFASLGAHLRTTFAPCCEEALTVDSICVFEQPGPGKHFRIAERFPLS